MEGDKSKTKEKAPKDFKRTSEYGSLKAGPRSCITVLWKYLKIVFATAFSDALES